MLAPVTHILPFTLIRRERLLPIPGKVLVRKGQKVSTTDTIAETNLAPEHLLLDVSRGLGMRAGQADEQIQVKAGDLVAAGDVLAGPVGLTRRVVRSPRNGRVILAGNGQVLLEVQGRPFALKAGLPGEVAELVSDRGAVVETTGAVVQGVWGNGPVDSGLLYVLAQEPDHVLTPDQIEVNYRGSVVLAGHCGEVETLKSAADLPLRGLILSSLDPSLLPLASRLPVAIMVIEGFGRRPMNSAAFKLLSTSERREVALNAEPWDRYAGTRPEVVISLPDSGALALPRDMDLFAPGQPVRIVRAPYAGEVGTLVDLHGVATFPSGVRAQAANVRLEDGSNAVIPLANLEVLQ